MARHQGQGDLAIELQAQGATDNPAQNPQPAQRGAGVLSAPFSLISAPVTSIGALWIKYLWDYAWPIQPGHQFRFVPKSEVPLSDVEHMQIVSVIGGLTRHTCA